MSRYIPEKLRKLVRQRANYICEYCLLHEYNSYSTFQIDHIISLKHRGKTIAENLAYSCLVCNRNKGSDIGSILFPNREFVRFFNPRVDIWSEHFKLSDAKILSLTSIAKATEKILEFNNIVRINERKLLIQGDQYPSFEALKILG